MTRTYKKETVTYERKTIIDVTCDWCGREIEPACERFETREFTLEYTEGDSYPSGGSKEGWQVEDLCDACVAKLRSLLIDQGITITSVEVDW